MPFLYFVNGDEHGRSCRTIEGMLYMQTEAERSYDDSMRFVVYGDRGNHKQGTTTEQSLLPTQNGDIDELINVSESLTISALEALYVGDSWGEITGSSSQHPAFGWILSLADVHVKGTASNLAFEALMIGWRAHKVDNRDMSIASCRRYNEALKTVAQLCQSNANASSDDLLAAVLLLALYETMCGSSNRVSSWINHMGGAYMLVAKRGPAIQNTYNGKCLFRDFRFHGVIVFPVKHRETWLTVQIIYAIGRRQTSFLSKLSWLGDPFQDAVRGDKDRLLDIMATLPSILEIADGLLAERDLERSLSLMYSMRNAYATITIKLANWRKIFQSKRSPDSQWYQNASLFTGPGEEHLLAMYPLAVHFPDIETAELDLLYWTIALILHGNFYLMLHIAQSSPFALLPIPKGFPHLNPGRDSYGYEDLFDPLDTECNMRIFVNNIAESLEYFLQPDTGVLAINSLVFPMALAMAFFDFFKDSRLEFFLAVADKIEAQHGVPLRDFLQNIPNQNILRLVKTADH